jgi:hypothetical protein
VNLLLLLVFLALLAILGPIFGADSRIAHDRWWWR